MGTDVISNNEETENVEKPSDIEQRIIRQVEYYFGNFNLGRDKFLKEEIKRDDGWVTLETLIRFNRLKQISVDLSEIAEALKKSSRQLLEVSDDCTKIRRRVPPPDNANQEEIEERTLYVKGFKKDTKLDVILDFFKEHKTENITMRKRKQGNKLFFKGSVFVTFETKQDSDAFLETNGLKFEKTELLKEKRKDYIKRKDIFYANLRAEKAQKTAERLAAGEKGPGKNCLLKFSGLAKNSTREEVRAAAEKLGDVAFVDYFRGNPHGTVRFEEGIVPDILKDIAEVDGEKKLDIGSVNAIVSLIEGEEEIKYLSSIKSRQRGNSKQGNKHNKQGYNKQGRFNKKGRGKRQDRDIDNDDQPSSKRVKTESSDGKEVRKEHISDDDQPHSKRVKTESSDEKEVRKEHISDNDQPPSKRVKIESSDGKSGKDETDISNKDVKPAISSKDDKVETVE